MYLGITLAGIAALAVFVLCLPVDGTLRLDVYGRPKFHMRVAWLYGLVGKDISEGKKPDEKKAPAPRRRLPRRMTIARLRQILSTRGLISQLVTLLRGMLAGLRIRNLEADFTVGLDNPADTGFVFALVGPATLLFNRHVSHRITVRPSFDSVLEGYLRGTVRLRPIRLVTPLLRFIFSVPSMRVMGKMARSRFKKGG